MAAQKRVSKKKTNSKAAPKRKGTRKTAPPKRGARNDVKRLTPIGFMQSNRGGWLIRALDTDLRRGQVVEVPRKDGSVSVVRILDIVYEGDFEDGTHCILAKFYSMDDEYSGERNRRQPRKRNNHFEEEEEGY